MYISNTFSYFVDNFFIVWNLMMNESWQFKYQIFSYGLSFSMVGLCFPSNGPQFTFHLLHLELRSTWYYGEIRSKTSLSPRGYSVLPAPASKAALPLIVERCHCQIKWSCLCVCFCTLSLSTSSAFLSNIYFIITIFLTRFVIQYLLEIRRLSPFTFIFVPLVLLPYNILVHLAQ